MKWWNLEDTRKRVDESRAEVPVTYKNWTKLSIVKLNELNKKLLVRKGLFENINDWIRALVDKRKENDKKIMKRLKDEKIKRVMKEFENGTLKSGIFNKLVTSKKKALKIAMAN